MVSYKEELALRRMRRTNNIKDRKRLQCLLLLFSSSNEIALSLGMSYKLSPPLYL
jgi:hypothetical protein